MCLWLMISSHQSYTGSKYKLVRLQFEQFICVHILCCLVAVKGETDPERKETKQKVEDDRKHEYPFTIIM